MGSLTDDLVELMASRLSSTQDLANLSRTSTVLRRGAGPLLQRVRDPVGLARQVDFNSPQLMAEIDHVLGLIVQLPPSQRFLPLQALATQAAPYFVWGHWSVHRHLTARITQAASGLPPHQQDQLQALLVRSPRSGWPIEPFGHGMF